MMNKLTVIFFTLIMISPFFSTILPLFSVTAATDLIVDGETIIISTAETYQSVVVKNGGNLTITSSDVAIMENLTVITNSFLKFTSLEA